MEASLVLPNAKPRKGRSYYYYAFRRFLKNRIALIGFGLVMVEILVAIFANFLAPYDPLALDMAKVLNPPFTSGHILGTDDLGRDMLSRLVFGARISFGVGLVVVLIAISIGVPLGALAGYFPKLDPWISFVIEVLLAFPGVILALGIVAALGPGLYSVMIAVGITSVPMYVRVVRGQVLSLKQRDYVISARALGMNELQILFQQVLPNCLGPIIVQATINIGTSILQAASLSFIGVGVQPPQPEWGAMLSQARSYIILAPYIVALPGIAIMSVVLGFNLLGDGLRDALDPRFNR
jgi:peptide/nickel transport system permease protein